MALFLVEVTFTLPVEAESVAAAEQDAAESWAREELHTNGLSDEAGVYARPLAGSDLARWGNSLPWGGDGESTIRNILNRSPSDG
jgi:hypothetical protein